MSEENIKNLLKDLVFDLKDELNENTNPNEDYDKGQRIAKIEVLSKIKTWLIGEYDGIIDEIGLNIDIDRELLNMPVLLSGKD